MAEMAQGKTLDQILNEADQNMYAAKGAGESSA
jgi:GGDEF domain-containing protein